MSRATSIGELAAIGALQFGDGYRTKRSEHGRPGYRIIRVADVMDGAVSFDGPDFVSADYVRAIGAKLGLPGDILLTTKGTVGRVAVLPEIDEQVVYSPQLCYFRVLDSDVVTPRFLRYWFRGQEFWNQAADRMNNTDMAAYINLADIRSLKMTLPSIPTQQAIAKVLGALDDKIAANTSLAATTDDFLGVRFLHLLQEDDDVVRLGEIADVNSTTVKPTVGGQLRYVDIASVSVGSYEFPELRAWDKAPSRARRGVRRGDTLWSTVRPNRRSHALNLSDDPRLVGSTGLAVLTPRMVGWAYLYEVTRRPEFTAYLETVAEGSAYPAVRADKFEDAPVPLLSEESRQLFESLAEPLRESAHRLYEENRSLAFTRDALLPQLLSGKLRVKDAEKVLEDAGV